MDTFEIFKTIKSYTRVSWIERDEGKGELDERFMKFWLNLKKEKAIIDL